MTPFIRASFLSRGGLTLSGTAQAVRRITKGRQPDHAEVMRKPLNRLFLFLIAGIPSRRAA